MKSLIVAFIICFGFMIFFVKLIQWTDRDNESQKIEHTIIEDLGTEHEYNNDSIIRISGNDTIWIMK